MSILGTAYRHVRRLSQTTVCRYPARVRCNVCGWRGRVFVGDSWHPRTICPACRSQVRHRLLVAALDHVPNLETARLVAGRRVLHFAPEPVLGALLSRPAARYVSADLTRGSVDQRLDLCDMRGLADASFDLFVACDVLEHVADDALAVREILRILADGGWAILTVPQKDGLASTYEDADIRAPRARKAAFGQEDHLRIYGADFEGWLSSQGFAVKTIDERSFPEALVREHVLFPPVLSAHPLATNHRKVFFAQKATE